MDVKMEKIKPCPFCGSSEVRFDVSKYWTGMRNVIMTVTLRHWCHIEGFTNQTISIRGKTEEEAREKWNGRV